MPQAARTFRIFVSSTFEDLKGERNALRERVFPELKELCLAHGARFQAIDLRWGVSEEASLDQQAINICVGEIERCRATSPRPNFIVLLGDRYGWRPPPPQIAADEFEQIRRRVTDEKDKELLEEWYLHDHNAVRLERCLRPRAGEVEDSDTWAPIERRLRSILTAAVRGSELEHDSRYGGSATEQEIVSVALSVLDAKEHVFCFFRAIVGLPEDESARSFRDLDEAGRQDGEAGRRLERLKDKLPTSFTAALLPRHLLHATLQKRLAQKLGTPRSERTRPSSGGSVPRRGEARSRELREPDESDQERQEDTSQPGHQSRAQTTLPGGGHAPA